MPVLTQRWSLAFRLVPSCPQALIGISGTAKGTLSLSFSVFSFHEQFPWPARKYAFVKWIPSLVTGIWIQPGSKQPIMGLMSSARDPWGCVSGKDHLCSHWNQCRGHPETTGNWRLFRAISSHLTITPPQLSYTNLHCRPSLRLGSMYERSLVHLPKCCFLATWCMLEPCPPCYLILSLLISSLAFIVSNLSLLSLSSLPQLSTSFTATKIYLFKAQACRSLP